MSRGLSRTYSLRKHIRPIIEVDEDDDEQRRDSFGRKRVDVIDCLLDSSPDEIDDENVNIERTQRILWLTLEEIRHIRYVLTQTSLISDKIRHGYLCFRCRKKINYFLFLPSFLRFTKHEICFICQQIICKKCSYTNFHPPSSKLLIPVRIEKLIKPASMIVENKNEKSTTQTEIVCYDCLQVNFSIQIINYDRLIVDIQ